MQSVSEHIHLIGVDELRYARSCINNELSLRFKEDNSDSHIPVCDSGLCPCTFKLPYGVSQEDLDLSEVKFNDTELVIYNLWKDDDKDELRRDFIEYMGTENRSDSIYIRLDMKKAFLKFRDHNTAALAQVALTHNGQFKVNFSATSDTVKLLHGKVKK